MVIILVGSSLQEAPLTLHIVKVSVVGMLNAMKMLHGAALITLLCQPALINQLLHGHRWSYNRYELNCVFDFHDTNCAKVGI